VSSEKERDETGAHREGLTREGRKRAESAGESPVGGLDGREDGRSRRQHQKMPIPDCKKPQNGGSRAVARVAFGFRVEYLGRDRTL